MVKLLVYMELKLGVNVKQFLYHLLQFLVHHMRYIKTLILIYPHLLMAQLQMVHIFHLYLGLDPLAQPFYMADDTHFLAAHLV